MSRAQSCLAFVILVASVLPAPVTAQAGKTVLENGPWEWATGNPNYLFNAGPGPVEIKYDWFKQDAFYGTTSRPGGPLPITLRLKRPNGTVAAEVLGSTVTPIRLTYQAVAADGERGWQVEISTMARTMIARMEIWHEPQTVQQYAGDLRIDSISRFWEVHERPAPQLDSLALRVAFHGLGLAPTEAYAMTCTAPGLSFIPSHPKPPLSDVRAVQTFFVSTEVDKLGSSLKVDCRINGGADMIDSQPVNNDMSRYVELASAFSTNFSWLNEAYLERCAPEGLPAVHGEPVCLVASILQTGANWAIDVDCSVGTQNVRFSPTDTRGVPARYPVGVIPPGAVLMSCVLDSQNKYRENDENDNKKLIAGVVHPAGTRFRYDVAVERMDSVLLLDRNGQVATPALSSIVRNNGEQRFYDIESGCLLNGQYLLKKQSMLEKLEPGERASVDMMARTSQVVAGGMHALSCFARITKPLYVTDATPSNDTLKATVRVIRVTDIPLAELLDARQDSYNGMRVVFDVRYRTSPGLSTSFGSKAKLKICVRDTNGSDLGARLQVDTLVDLVRTSWDGAHALIGATWTDSLSDPPKQAVVRAEVVREGSPQASSTACTTGTQPSPTMDTNAQLTLYAARDFPVSLGWTAPVTMTPTDPKSPIGFGPSRPPQTPPSSPPPERIKKPPVRRPPARPPTPSPAEIPAEMPRGKSGSFRIEFPSEVVSGENATFVCMVTDGVVNLGITFNDKVVGAIGGKLPRVATGKFPISVDTEQGLSVGFARSDPPAGFTGRSGTVTITEWTSEIMRGSFRFAGNYDDESARPYTVTGTFAAVPVIGCM